MSAPAGITGQNAFAALRRMAQPRATIEQCEFCSLPLSAGHRHLLETATRKIICACDACALRFDNVVGRWKLIPRDARPLPDLRMSDAQWDGLSLPIQLAFLFHSTPAQKVIAMYPSPAGATESLLSLANWQELVSENPVLSAMQPDVEALLCNRLKDAREYYLAPIDVCFELVGLIRLHWRGFSGGDKVWTELDSFFNRLRGTPDGAADRLQEAGHA
jgi:hypothetical protein